jgi:hypothetical protein
MPPLATVILQPVRDGAVSDLLWQIGTLQSCELELDGATIECAKSFLEFLRKSLVNGRGTSRMAVYSQGKAVAPGGL